MLIIKKYRMEISGMLARTVAVGIKQQLLTVAESHSLDCPKPN